MLAYIIQEFSQLDGHWHNVCMSSSANGIYADKTQARYVCQPLLTKVRSILLKNINELFKKANDNPSHLRLITCKLSIMKAECGEHKVSFNRELVNA